MGTGAVAVRGPRQTAGQLVVLGLFAGACHTAGSDWMSQPLPGSESPWPERTYDVQVPASSAPIAPSKTRSPPNVGPEPAPEGRVIGVFRNTYYDFPNEAAFSGADVPLMNAECQPIKQVPRGFHDAVCVQGSGFLSSGSTVSFARRNCECAELCPRTEQKICFDLLPVEQFPWGRGALGKPITPLRTVAVDDSVIPMRTRLYVPELAGLPQSTQSGDPHDGCFVAEDRGLRVKGQHIDIFTGDPSMTRLWNQAVPSNQGVTVVVDSPHCPSNAAP